MLLDVLQESDGARKLHAVDSLGSFTGVLEGNPEKRAARFRRLSFIVGGSSVADL